MDESILYSSTGFSNVPLSSQQRYDRVRVPLEEIKHLVCYECGELLPTPNEYEDHILEHEAGSVALQLYLYESKQERDMQAQIQKDNPIVEGAPAKKYRLSEEEQNIIVDVDSCDDDPPTSSTSGLSKPRIRADDPEFASKVLFEALSDELFASFSLKDSSEPNKKKGRSQQKTCDESLISIMAYRDLKLKRSKIITERFRKSTEKCGKQESCKKKTSGLLTSWLSKAKSPSSTRRRNTNTKKLSQWRTKIPTPETVELDLFTEDVDIDDGRLQKLLVNKEDSSNASSIVVFDQNASSMGEIDCETPKPVKSKKRSWNEPNSNSAKRPRRSQRDLQLEKCKEDYQRILQTITKVASGRMNKYLTRQALNHLKVINLDSNGGDRVFVDIRGHDHLPLVVLVPLMNPAV